MKTLPSINKKSASTRKALKGINAIMSCNQYEYFGTYRGIEWILNGLRDGNKVWWYITDMDGQQDMPTTNLADAVECLKSDIDYEIDYTRASDLDKVAYNKMNF